MQQEVLLCLAGYSGQLFKPLKSFRAETNRIETVGFYVEDGSLHIGEVSILNRLGKLGFICHQLKKIVNDQDEAYFRACFQSGSVNSEYFRKALCDGIRIILKDYKSCLIELQTSMNQENPKFIPLTVFLSHVTTVCYYNSSMNPFYLNLAIFM